MLQPGRKFVKPNLGLGIRRAQDINVAKMINSDGIQYWVQIIKRLYLKNKSFFRTKKNVDY